MIFDKGWRIRRLQVKIAGLKALLQSSTAVFNACQKNIPGHIVVKVIETPQKIAELETLVEQLREAQKKTPGDKLNGRKVLQGG